MSWKDEVYNLHFVKGLSWTEAAKEMRYAFPDSSEKQVIEKIRAPFRLKKGSKGKKQKAITDEQFLAALKVKRTPQQDADILCMPVTEFVRQADKLLEAGYNVREDNGMIWLESSAIQNLTPATIDADWNGNKLVRFALIGDTHLNNKYTQISYLHNFYAECKRQGITHVYHAGDIDDGEQMRPGHQYECYCQGADEHVDEIVKSFPMIEGITTHFITGNHDSSITKRCGYNIGPAIASKRPDMQYLGQDCAIVKLTPNCTLELRHPWDGTAYSLSYKPQKMIEAMAGGEKPNILAIGHYHKAEYLFYRNVHSFQVGTFCAQTPFMRGKGISAHMGGWIVEISVDDNGYIQRIVPQFIPFYYAQADDWKKWR